MADPRAHTLVRGDRSGAAELTSGDVRETGEYWYHLAWQVPLAALLTLAQFMGLVLLVEPPGIMAPAPRPLEVEVSEMPAPPVASVLPESRTKLRRLLPSLPSGRIQAEPTRASARQISPPPVPASPPPASGAEPVIEAADLARPMMRSGLVENERVERSASGPGVSAPSSARAPDATASNPVSGVRGGTLGGGNAGARAIYQPRPEIPETLRHRSIETTTVARFRVAANGSAEVELIEPTPDSELNRAVLDALRKWRFFPALQDGKPVASTLDIRIPISVK